MFNYALFIIFFFNILAICLNQESSQNKTSEKIVGNDSNGESQADQEEDLITINKAKLIACIRLARARLHHQKEKVNELIELAGSEKVMSTLLISCYSKVSIEQATTLVEKQKHEDIEALLPENIELLELEKWTEIYRKKDKELVFKELSKLEEAGDSFMKIQNLLEMESDEEDKRNAVNNKKNEQKEIPKEKRKRSSNNDFNLFGISLMDMDPMVKNMIGLGFLITVITLLYMGMSRLTQKQPEKLEKSKKNKKSKNK